MDPKTIKENSDNYRKFIDSYTPNENVEPIDESTESEELEYFTE